MQSVGTDRTSCVVGEGENFPGEGAEGKGGTSEGRSSAPRFSHWQGLWLQGERRLKPVPSSSLQNTYWPIAHKRWSQCSKRGKHALESA